ncbi:MAG TPA: hypothetical protein VFJ19_17085, partial [Nocardioidaceae bacterium]|nr:hypothetical protein [Nocardioidaceae bacterium]
MADSSLHVVTANVDKATRGAKMRAAIDLPARGADVVAYQEVERLRHVKAVAALSGFDAYLPAGRKRSWKNACPIVWRDHLTRLDAGWVLIGKGVRLIQPNRVATWVLLRDDDPARTTYAVVSAHTVSGIWKRALRKIAAWAGRTRRQESDRELAAIAALAQQLRSRADVVIVMGDLNRPERISPALIGCDQIIYASAPTHGRHWFDLIGLIGATGSGAHRIATPSDHDALAATVTPTSSSKPPTRKQEEPVSVAPPSPPFIAARHHGGHQTPRAIVMHGTVSPCDRGRARSIAAWWHGSGSPVTSAHYIVDPYQIVQCVGDHTVAYHCGYNDG